MIELGELSQKTWKGIRGMHDGEKIFEFIT